MGMSVGWSKEAVIGENIAWLWNCVLCAVHQRNNNWSVTKSEFEPKCSGRHAPPVRMLESSATRRQRKLQLRLEQRLQKKIVKCFERFQT